MTFSPKDLVAGYVVYRRVRSDENKFFLLMSQREDGMGMEYLIHEDMDGAEAQVCDNIGNAQIGRKKDDYIIQALYWVGGSIPIRNSIPKEVE